VPATRGEHGISPRPHAPQDLGELVHRLVSCYEPVDAGLRTGEDVVLVAGAEGDHVDAAAGLTDAGATVREPGRPRPEVDPPIVDRR